MRATPAALLAASLLCFSALYTAGQAISIPMHQEPQQTPAQKAAAPNVHHEANYDAQFKQAMALITAHKDLEALPLCADLTRQDPTDGRLAECRARGLMTKTGIEKTPADAQHNQAEALAELRRAVALGDNTNWVLSMIDLLTTTRTPSPGYQESKNPDAVAALKQGEAAFSQRDFKAAFAAYVHASELDPAYYTARLFAGDACFTSGDYTCAGEWFGKAIALDPNRETAYRYWGDALDKGGHTHEGKQKFEQAIVAEPYVRLSWNGLLQWAQLTKTRMDSIVIPRPKVDPANNKVNITVSPNGSPAEMMAMLAYGGCRAGDIKKGGAPKAKDAPMPAYSPELEAECLDTAADAVLASKPKDTDLSPGLRSLLALKKDGMIECWVLLNSGDPQTPATYAAYRDAHRDLLVAYLDKYVVHEGVIATSPPKLSDQK